MAQSTEERTSPEISLANEIRAKYAAQKGVFIETARQYAEEGLWVLVLCSAVTTIKGRYAGKSPIKLKWNEARSWPSEVIESMEAQFATQGGANIGVKTGKDSGIVCIDIDINDQGSGMAWFHDNEHRLGNYIREETGSGGLHLYYRYPEGVDFLKTKSSTSRLFDGVDILADGHGQVVTWPSIHPTTGRQYTLKNATSLLDVRHEADELPQWIVEAILASMKEERPATTEEGGDAEVADIKAAIIAVRDLPPAVQGYGGDGQTLKAAMLCRDKGLSRKETLELLMEQYNPRCIPPWTKEELWRKVKNAYKYAKKPKGSERAAAAFPEPLIEPMAQADEPSEEPQGENHLRRTCENIKRVGGYHLDVPVPSAINFLEKHEDMFLASQCQLYGYDKANCRWQMLADGEFDSIIARDFERSAPTIFTNAQAKHITEIRKAAKNRLQGDDVKRVFQPETWLDGRQGEFVSLNNGILDIQSRQLGSHSPKFFTFSKLPFAYDVAAQCPTFLWFLNDIWDGDKELQRSLQLWMGYLVLSTMRFQKFAVLKGKSRGGKGTLAWVMEQLMGDGNYISPQITAMANDFALEQFIGKKLATFHEAERARPEHLAIAGERIKTITGNDSIGINRKNQSYINVTLPTKIVLVCNRFPQFSNDESALTNRMLVFPFWKSYARNPDTTLKDRLRAELPGIFNWALDGASAIIEGAKLAQSQKGANELSEIITQLNPILSFISERVLYTGESHNYVTSNELWSAYKAWSQDSNRPAMSSQRFWRELNSHLDERVARDRVVSGRIYRGMTLVDGSLGFFGDDGSEPPF